MFKYVAAACAAAAFAVSAASEDAAARLTLISPIDCDLNGECWVAQYMDLEPGADARDPACGSRTYDGHKGVDFAVPDLISVSEGVRVLAAAGGRISAVRNHMADVLVGAANEDDVAGLECGNGVVIDHGGGWETQYCHMREGSVVAAVGDEVQPGAVMGLVGYSGAAEFPHLHMSVRHRGEPVDPFSGRSPAQGCDGPFSPLWDEAAGLNYEPAVIARVGFAGEAADYATALAGRYRSEELPASSGAFVAWADMYGVQDGDELVMRIATPAGGVFVAEDFTIERTQARRFQFIGRRLREERWPAGVYRTSVRLSRNGVEIDAREAEVIVER